METMLTDTPLVSVIMVTYNEPPAVVTTAILSILRQTYDNIELIVVDDSTDKASVDAIDQCAQDSRVVLVRNEKRLGMTPAKNVGLGLAKGKYIAMMDGDDISAQDRLEKQVDFLNTHPDVDVVGGQVNIIDLKDQVTSSRRFPLGGVSFSLFSSFRNPLAHPTVMLRREVVDAGFRYNEELEMSEDLDLWLRLMNSGYKLANISDVVLDYRIDDGFLEKRTKRKQIEYLARVRRMNLSRKYPVRSALSWCTAILFLHMPVGVLQRIYHHENRQ